MMAVTSVAAFSLAVARNFSKLFRVCASAPSVMLDDVPPGPFL